MEEAIRYAVKLFYWRLIDHPAMNGREDILDRTLKQVDAIIPNIREHYMREVGNVYRMWLDYSAEPAQSNRRTVELSGKGISEQARRNLAKLVRGDT
jgi:hypothetical protein